MNNPNEQNSTSLTGIGSMFYIIPKDDLQPDTLTPKEGKAWSKIDVNKSYSISVDVEPSDNFKPFEIPIERERHLFSYDPLTSEQLYEIAKRTGFVPKEAVENMMQFEQDKAEDSCKKLWEQIQNAPFDVFITDKDGNAQHIGKVDPKNITVRRIAVNVPHFRRRRLHIKYAKKLARYIMVRDAVPSYFMRQARQNVIDEIFSSRKASHNLNRAIKQLKRMQTNEPQD